ncbi:HAD-IA family hydrolase [Ammonicoccus fulvus]|uniref:HAD-IA family hydrolase n=1 Tax=Ammonicoccus fulvus TaxID=3138240 RepID=A0ABZ3FP01_9ACTN
MELRALIFDVDGTLADTEDQGHRPAFNDAFADAGLAWHWDPELYRDLLAVTGGKERIQHFCERFDPDFLHRPDADEAIARLHRAKTAHYGRRVADGHVELLPGVRELIAEARAADLRLAIATTTSPENVTSLLTATLGANSPSWFDVIGAGDIVAAKKPAPDIYLWVLQRLDVPAGTCVAFEDSLPGYAAARAAGLPVVVTPSGGLTAADFPEALAVWPTLAATDLRELTALHATGTP